MYSNQEPFGNTFYVGSEFVRVVATYCRDKFCCQTGIGIGTEWTMQLPIALKLTH
jgi:hypothetical protein